jgi:hypothetical protein
MWENNAVTGLRALQERLGCKGCYFTLEKARLDGSPCCTKNSDVDTGLVGECLDRITAYGGKSGV